MAAAVRNGRSPSPSEHRQLLRSFSPSKVRCYKRMIEKFAPFFLLIILLWMLVDYFGGLYCLKSDLQGTHGDKELAAMVVGDLHLSGPNTAWIDRVRRESSMKASFKKAYKKLKPDILLVLGDISDRGRKSTNKEWESVVQRFHNMLLPYSDALIHVAVGNHDVGDYYEMSPSLLQRFVVSFPDLDETGSSLFMVENVTFISLNAMALACENCPSHFAVKGLVDKARYLLVKSLNEEKQRTNPRLVVLLHLPLYRTDESVCNFIDTPRCGPWHEVEGACLLLGRSGDSFHSPLVQYRDKMDMLSASTSEYLLSALKPRLVLSAHAHRFCDRFHDDGTREITVSTFSWRNRDDPSFLFITFFKDGFIGSQQCFLPRESMVLGVQVLQGTIISLGLVIAGVECCKARRKLHLKT